MNDKLTTAIEYANKGFSVLPMDGKQPLIKFANQPPLTVKQIKNYWSKWPEANIALRTVDFFVLDIDTKAGHGVNGMKSYHELPNGVIIPTLSQRTASGGYQMFFKKPDNNQVKQIIGWRPGIDIKAHVNNYVVVPPSTTDRGQYKWINENAPIKPASQQLLKLIDDWHPATNKQPDYYPQQTGKRWTGQVLDNIVQGAPEGQRNDYMTRLCGQLIHAGAENETVWTLINYANQFNTPPLDNREVGKIVASVLREELKKFD